MRKVKKEKKQKKSLRNVTPELPQNIIPVGERVFEDKNIYIHQKVYDQIHKFSANKTENEHGGILVGRVLNEMGKENTIIEGFIEAKYNTATPTTLTFTHETWDYFHAELERRFSGKKIVGWIHTHPNFGIFLSENDRFIQENFFTDANQVAYVVDPIQFEEGFFFWIDDKLERCPGFYIFDKNGVKIKQKIWSGEDFDPDAETEVKVGKTSKLLVFLLIINIIITCFQGFRIHGLEKKVEDQELVIRYGLLSMYGAPEISQTADNIRMQLEMQRQYEEQMRKEQEAQTEAEAGKETEDAQGDVTPSEEQEGNTDDAKDNGTDENGGQA